MIFGHRNIDTSHRAKIREIGRRAILLFPSQRRSIATQQPGSRSTMLESAVYRVNFVFSVTRRVAREKERDEGRRGTKKMRKFGGRDSKERRPSASESPSASKKSTRKFAARPLAPLSPREISPGEIREKNDSERSSGRRSSPLTPFSLSFSLFYPFFLSFFVVHFFSYRETPLRPGFTREFKIRRNRCVPVPPFASYSPRPTQLYCWKYFLRFEGSPGKRELLPG